MNFTKTKNNYKTIIYFIIIFLVLACFFIRNHPIVLFDTDDWLYTGITREAIPKAEEYNPSKLLPETIMPLVSSLGVNIFMPFTNDYISSLTIMNGLVVSIAITIYIYCFYKLIKKYFKFNDFTLFGISTLFLLLHFIIFRNGMSDNLYMFYAVDPTCYYNYIIPALLNCSLVMYFITDGTFNKKNSTTKISILVLLCYLAIFSNMFQSIILAVYISLSLLFDYINSKDKKIFKFIKNNYSRLIIIIMWVAQHIFELTGGRADSVGNFSSPIANIKTTLSYFFDTMMNCNKAFKCIILACIIMFIFEFFKEKLYRKNLIKIIPISALLTIIYLILLCSVTFPYYISRIEIIFGFVFYILIAICLTLSLSIKRWDLLEYLLPLILFILLFETETTGVTFKESNILNIPYQNCIEIDNIIINQVKEIDKSGNESGTIYIPKFETGDNWPIGTYGVERISRTLYSHGIITREIKLDYEFSNEMYEKLLAN